METISLNEVMIKDKDLVLKLYCQKDKAGEVQCYVGELGKVENSGLNGRPEFNQIGIIYTETLADLIDYLPGAYQMQAEWNMMGFVDPKTEVDAERFLVMGGMASIKALDEDYFIADVSLGGYSTSFDGTSLNEVVSQVSYSNFEALEKTNNEIIM